LLSVGSNCYVNLQMSSSPSSRLEFIESLRLLAALLVFFQRTITRYRDITLLDSPIRLGPSLAGVVRVAR